MNRPASTYVIIAHFTASGDFSQTKRGGEGKREWQRKQLVAIRAPLHHGPVNNGTSATAKWHFGIWVTISQLESSPRLVPRLEQLPCQVDARRTSII